MSAKQYFNARAIAPKPGVSPFARSAKKQTPYVSVIFEVTGAPVEGQDPPRYEWQGYFSENTQERTIESLRHAGCTFPGDNLKDLTGLGSKMVRITVETDDFGPRVAWVDPPKEGSINDENRLGGNDLDAFAKSMKGLLSATRSGPAPRRAAPTRSASMVADSGPDPWERPASAGANGTGGGREMGDDGDQF